MIKDQNLAEQLLGEMESLLDLSAELKQSVEQESKQPLSPILDNAKEILEKLLRAFIALQKENADFNLSKAVLSIQKSLIGIYSLYKKQERSKAINKIEYEFIPLIEEMRANFYFWACVYPDRERMNHYYKDEMKKYYCNRYLEHAEKTGSYPYEVSIIVLAYNKLDYTQMCVESLLHFMPEGLNYELILVNHGSTDGTKEYFESMEPHKQLDIAVNGGGVGAVYRICEGKYSLHISNDILITPNAIENMLRCMRSDEDIAWVVPSTPNVTNCQAIPLKYKDIPQLWDAAEENNQLDPFRWEQRTRLCNPIDLRRNSAFYETQAATYPFAENAFTFPDDKISLLLRRNGYKLILEKDAYCYHFGSVTLKTEVEAQGVEQAYETGKELFYNAFQIDPWGRGHCYDPYLFKLLPCEKTGNVRILGINPGIGSNPLKIKEALKENMHNTDCTLYNYLMDTVYLQDLKGIPDEIRMLSSWDDFEECNHGLDFDYIVSEDLIGEQSELQETVSLLQKYLRKDGYLIVRMLEKQLADWSEKTYSAITTIACESTDYWAIIKN